MKQYKNSMTLSLCFAALVLVAVAPAFADDLPTGPEIMDRITEATGGVEAIEKIESAITRGKMTMEAMNISGTITTWSKKPGLVRAEVELAGLGKVNRGAKDGIAYEYSPLMGPRLMEGSERDFMLLESDLGWSADWRKHYQDVECTGEKEVNGEDCYIVSLVFKGDHEMTMAVNKETNLPESMDMEMEVQGNTIPVEILYEEYGAFGDLTLPTKITQNVLSNTVAVSFDSYEFNTDIPDSTFDIPAEVQALIDAEAGTDAPDEVEEEPKDE